jgi:hypothetical protein
VLRHTRWQALSTGFDGEVVVCGLCGRTGGDDVPEELGGAAAAGAAQHVEPVGTGVAVFGRLGHAPVNVDVVGFAATRHRHVQRGAGRFFAEDGVGGVGGALSSLKGRGVSRGC